MYDCGLRIQSIVSKFFGGLRIVVYVGLRDWLNCPIQAGHPPVISKIRGESNPVIAAMHFLPPGVPIT